jgi:hypothetical protein
MKYLTLSADYLDYSLQGDSGEPVDRALIPPDIVGELEDWNADYQSIIPLPTEERASKEILDKIQHLDSRGVCLAANVASSIPGAPKAIYYSEGLLRRL